MNEWPAVGLRATSEYTSIPEEDGSGIQVFADDDDLDTLLKDLAALRAALAALKEAEKADSDLARKLKGRIEKVVRKIDAILQKKYPL